MIYRDFNLIKPEMLQYMTPMGRTKSVMSTAEMIGTPEAKAGIASFQSEINAYARKMARQAATNYQRSIKEGAFNRAHQGFDATKSIANYIYRNLK